MSPALSFSPSSPPSSSEESEDEYYKAPKPKDKLVSARAERFKRTFDLTTPVTQNLQSKELNSKFLNDLLDPNQLKNECEQVEVAADALARPSGIRLANDSPRMVAGTIVDQIDRNNELGTRIYFELPSGSSSEWGARLATLTINCIADVGSSLPDMILHAGIHDLVARGIQAQVCRSLIAVYQWIANLGPSLARQLVSIHQTEGAAELEQKFPDLAPLVTHVVEFVRAHQTQQQLNKPKTGRGGRRARGRPKKRRPGESSEQASMQDEPTDEPSDCPNEVGTSLPRKKSQIPGDLFGLLPASSSMITLEPLGPTVLVKDDETLYKISAKYLCKIWEEHLVLKPMLKVDQYLNPNQPQPRSREAMEGVRDRCITRGAILQSIADIFGDGLFASNSMTSFLHRPSHMFSRKDQHLARAIEKDERGTLSVLDAHLISALVESPEVEEYSAKLGELVHRALLSLKLGYALTDEEYENPHELLTANDSFSKLAASSKRTSKPTLRTVTEISPTVQSLLPKNPSFGIAAVIVREALSSRRKKPPTPETAIYRRMLEGKHPMTGHPTKHDPDQMNPIRADLNGLKLLHQVLSPRLFTTATGLSSLLVFMGTGQGTMTEEFLQLVKANEDKMHFTTLKACVDQFRAIETRNATLGEAAAIKYDNPAIYGQPNPWYSAHPTVRAGRNSYVTLSLFQKLSPYFVLELQRSWLAFLGPLANQDPAFSSAPKKSWADVIRWIVQSGLNGFGSGLAPLQFANNMVLAGVATSPSPEAMAQWIFANKSYGAFAGLRVLGFNLAKKASPAAVRAAFMCFYLWLDRHLSCRDKRRLRFDTIFVEQLLCKIGRWKGRMKTMAKKQLDKDAVDLLDAEDWKQGANLKDHTKFPFPSCKAFSLSIFRGIIEEG